MNPRTQVKICGVNDPAAFDAAMAAEADWVGFVFYPASPRALSPAQAAALSARARSGPRRVGLFVRPSHDEVAAALAAIRLDVLQVYGSEHQVAALKSAFGLPVWRAVPIATQADLPAACEPADALVIEPRPPEGASRPGGNAMSLDWRMLAGWRPRFPWLLAGGLTPANVAEAIRLSGTAAVDVSSGVESAPGRKSPELIAAFVAAARDPAPADAA